MVRRGAGVLLAAAQLAGCGSGAAAGALVPTADEQALAQASWEVVHEASDAMAPTYPGRTAHASLGALPDARDACFSQALEGNSLAAAAAGASDSNSLATLTFGAACRVGGRTLTGSETLATFVHVQPPARQVAQAGSYTIALAGGGSWQASGGPAAAPPGLAQLNSLIDGQVYQNHFTLLLNARRTIVSAAAASLALVASSTGDPQAVVTVAETADPTGMRMAAERTVEQGIVGLVVDGGPTGAHTFAGVATSFSAGCLCPAAGTLVQALTYSDGTATTHQYTFDGCGQATVTSQSQGVAGFVSGVSQVTWPACS